MEVSSSKPFLFKCTNKISAAFNSIAMKLNISYIPSGLVYMPKCRTR